MSREPDVLGIAAFWPLVRQTYAVRLWLAHEEWHRAVRILRETLDPPVLVALARFGRFTEAMRRLGRREGP
jgi:hypothetical protein